VTIARALSNTFADIAPSDAPGFIVAQLIGAVAAASPQSNHPAPEHQGVFKYAALRSACARYQDKSQVHSTS